jgi:hypothetical protein
MKLLIDSQDFTREEIRKVVEMLEVMVRKKKESTNETRYDLDLANDAIRAAREAFALYGYGLPCLDDMVHKMALDSGLIRKYPSELTATS